MVRRELVTSEAIETDSNSASPYCFSLSGIGSRENGYEEGWARGALFLGAE